MFSCPTGSVAQNEGESDENPIRLQGDTLEQVRALMWSLYALYVSLLLPMTSICVLIKLTLMNRPHERQDANDSNRVAALHMCCCLARIAHKYHFQSVETWVLKTLSEFWAQPGTSTYMRKLAETTRQNFGPFACNQRSRTAWPLQCHGTCILCHDDIGA
jgi:hypothetical protein